MDGDDFQLTRIVSAPFEENSYVAYRSGSTECLVFDPGTEPEPIIDSIASKGLTPAAILLTHGHADHIAGNAALKKRWPNCPLLIGRGDAEKLTDARLNLSAAFGMPIISPPADRLLADCEVVQAAGFELLVREIPGHSIGHVVFIWREPRPMYVFGGDVLFAGSIGRTDFPDGSMPQLAKGIHRHLFSLPDDTIVLSGHGEPTTIGAEKATNQFVGRPAGWRGGKVEGGNAEG
jgi:glyoxylase-like metal-dependent hydrolase (beta-lactamase superfamily II)